MREVALCYLDGIKHTVGKRKDYVKLHLAFRTAAMAKRESCNHGMKNKGMSIRFWELMTRDERRSPIKTRKQGELSSSRSTEIALKEFDII